MLLLKCLVVIYQNRSLYSSTFCSVGKVTLIIIGPFFIQKDVIPVPRHWDPAKLIVNKRTIQHFQ
nr:WPE palindromic element domain-containing protein [Wolbachia endosymbiont of Atemnus politus]